MPLQPPVSIAQALFSVFIKPSLPPTSMLPRAKFQQLRPGRCTTIRSYARKMTPNKYRDQPEHKHIILDQKIGSRNIDYVDETGTINRGQSLHGVLQSLDRRSEHVMLVQPRDPRNPEALPVCRHVTKERLREMAVREAEQIAATKKRQRDEKPKVVEIGWSVSKNDMQRKMRMLKEWLEDGRRVEIEFMKKKGTRLPPEAACQAIVNEVKQLVENIPGCKEKAKPEGKLAGTFTLFYAGSAKKRETPVKEATAKETPKDTTKDAQKDSQKEATEGVAKDVAQESVQQSSDDIVKSAAQASR